ncbi:MAG: enoyl-CoA hydratase/isomerase family protein [Dehalococcoidia bacterium]
MSAILFSVENKVAYITINRPQVLNAIDAEVRKGLTEAWIRVRDDDDVWAAILTGAGDKAFTAGADIKEFSEFHQAKKGLTELYDLPRPTQELGVWKPIIAAIDGYCLGGGLVLAMDCDIRVATERAIFGMPEVALSQVPGWWVATRAFLEKRQPQYKGR